MAGRLSSIGLPSTKAFSGSNGRVALAPKYASSAYLKPAIPKRRGSVISTLSPADSSMSVLSGMSHGLVQWFIPLKLLHKAIGGVYVRQ